MSRRYSRPRLLAGDDEFEFFECRSAEQTEWLRRHARQASAAGTVRVLVVTEPGSSIVVAYYAWCMASIRIEDAPPRMRKGVGRYPQPLPCSLVWELASSTRAKGLVPDSFKT